MDTVFGEGFASGDSYRDEALRRAKQALKRAKQERKKAKKRLEEADHAVADIEDVIRRLS